jgi:hypothetical protein
MNEVLSIENPEIGKDEQKTIVETIFNRMRFNYGAIEIFSYIANCICIRKKRYLAKDPALRKHVLFSKGSGKLADELDCITLVRSIRMLKLLTQVFLNKD